MRAIKHRSATVKEMYRILKNDLKHVTDVSYGSESLCLTVNGRRVEWELKESKRLYRWSGADFAWTTSTAPVESFKYTGLFGKYFAVEIVAKGESMTVFAKIGS